jgi:hypothetical protein
MASIESLPPDQRAVLQLVLQRGRSYDDIAQLLSIDPGAVQQRAHAALDALGPQTRIDPEHRAQIADYLLGQQSEADAAQTRERLAGSASERAWGRVVASELSPLAGGSLPEIPAEGGHEAPAAGPSPAPELGEALGSIQQPGPAPLETSHEPAGEPAAAAPSGSDTPPPVGERPVSRRGGAILIAAAAAVIVIVVVVVLIASGGSSNSPSTTTNAGAPTTTPAGASGATGSTASTGSTGATGASSTKVLAQFNLSSPTSKKTIGIAQFLRAGGQYGIAVVAENIQPNTKKNAYAVWLYNSPTQAELLGFVNPGVGSTGRLSTAGPLPANASQYHELLVTLETQSKPKTPGPIVLQGQVTLTATG